MSQVIERRNKGMDGGLPSKRRKIYMRLRYGISVVKIGEKDVKERKGNATHRIFILSTS